MYHVVCSTRPDTSAKRLVLTKRENGYQKTFYAAKTEELFKGGKCCKNAKSASLKHHRGKAERRAGG